MGERIRRIARSERDGKLLLGSFLVRSALAFVLIGVLVHVLVGRQVEDRYETSAQFHAEFVARSMLQHELATVDVSGSGGFSPDVREHLQHFIDDHVMVGDILRLKVWHPDGTILLSDDPDLVGQRSPEKAGHLAAVLVDGTETHRERVDDHDIGAVVDTLETYVPIEVDGAGVVVELYTDLGPTIAAANDFTRTFDVILAMGLVGLWGLLVPIVRRTARKIERQNADLERLLALEKETVRRLEELGEMKDTFLTAVSHELRTPLTVLKSGTATLIQHGDKLSPELFADLMGRIGRNADRLESLLASLLDLDRLSRGAIESDPAPTDLRDLVDRVVDTIAPERPVAVDVPSVVVHVDGAQIERVVENLVYNALRHTPDHAGIRIGADVRDQHVVLRVEDDGAGVPDELKQAIFEPFTQGEVLRPESPGTGVGLALVRRFVELNGGRAWVEDAPSGGASFCVSLPTAHVAPRPQVQTPA